MILKGRVSTENFPDSKYFATTMPYTSFIGSITSQVNFVYDANLCSALCTLRLHDCNFFVQAYDNCYMGALGAAGGFSAITPGSYTVMTRRCELNGSKNF